MGYVYQTAMPSTNPTKVTISLWILVKQAAFDAMGAFGETNILTFGKGTPAGTGADATQVFSRLSIKNNLSLFPPGPFLGGGFTSVKNSVTVTRADGSSTTVSPFVGWSSTSSSDFIGMNFLVDEWNHIAISADLSRGARTIISTPLDQVQNGFYILNPTVSNLLSSDIIYAALNQVDCSPTACSIGGLTFLSSPADPNAFIVIPANTNPANPPLYAEVWGTDLITAPRGTASYRWWDGLPLLGNYGRIVGGINRTTGCTIGTQGFPIGIPMQPGTIFNGGVPTHQMMSLAYVQIWFGQVLDVATNVDLFVTSDGFPTQWGSGGPAWQELGVPNYAHRHGQADFATNDGTDGSFISVGTITDFVPPPGSPSALGPGV